MVNMEIQNEYVLSSSLSYPTFKIILEERACTNFLETALSQPVLLEMGVKSEICFINRFITRWIS